MNTDDHRYHDNLTSTISPFPNDERINFNLLSFHCPFQVCYGTERPNNCHSILSVWVAHWCSVMSRKTILAIDFGTSNSVAYLFRNGIPQIVNDDTTTGLTSFPSLVAYDKGEVYTCNAAKEGRRDGRYEYVVSCVKRLIGLSYDEYLHLPDQTVFGCEVKKGSDEKPCFVVSADGMEKDCIEVASELFNTIKKSAMRMNNHEEIDECYVTVPANYKDHQREAIMKAAQRAGLKVMSVVPEPTAAAMSWCFENKNSIGIGEKMLVFDFGGGTLDISVIDKYSSAYRNVLWKLWKCDRADSFVTLHFSCGKRECIAVLDSNRLVILKVFKSYLRSFCIKKSCNINAKFFP